MRLAPQLGLDYLVLLMFLALTGHCESRVREFEGPDPETYASHFGSWKAALAEVGLEPRTSRRYESEEPLQRLRELAEELGHTPTIAKLQARKDLPSPYTYRDRFGRWNEALRQAGLTLRHPINCQEDTGDG